MVEKEVYIIEESRDSVSQYRVDLKRLSMAL